MKLDQIEPRWEIELEFSAGIFFRAGKNRSQKSWNFGEEISI